MKPPWPLHLTPSKNCKRCNNNNSSLVCAFLEMFCKIVSGREMERPEIAVGVRVCASTQHMSGNEV